MTVRFLRFDKSHIAVASEKPRCIERTTFPSEEPIITKTSVFHYPLPLRLGRILRRLCPSSHLSHASDARPTLRERGLADYHGTGKVNDAY